MLRQVNRHFGVIEKELRRKWKEIGIQKWKNGKIGFVGVLLHKMVTWQYLQSLFWPCKTQLPRGAASARQPCYHILTSLDLGQWLCVPPFRDGLPFSNVPLCFFNMRPLKNALFCSILVIARSETTKQSPGLSRSCEIASLRSQWQYGYFAKVSIYKPLLQHSNCLKKQS